MIRVLHVITGLGAGGAEAMLSKLVARMDRSRFQSLVVSLTDKGVLGKSIEDAGTPVETLGLKRGMPDPRGFLRLRKIVHTWKPDVMQSWMYHADVLATLSHTGVPHLWNIRCSYVDMSDYSRLSSVTLNVAARLSKSPAGIVVNSISGRDYHQRIGFAAKAWYFIPNGFDLERFRPNAEARRDVRAEIGIDDATPLVALLARVDPMKDHANFFAAAELIARETNVHFLLAGEGVGELHPPAALAGRVHLLGLRRDVERLLAAADVLVLASAHGEGFPNVLGEAMACGAICVTTAVGDAAAIVSDCGIVVPPRDAVALADGMRRALQLPEGERAALVARGRARMEHDYSIGAVAARYEELYQSITRGETRHDG